MKKFIFILFVLIANIAFSQHVVTGTVFDNEDRPMPGVNILIKNTTIGTITDIDGKYSITVPDSLTTLVVSFIGYEIKEVDISGETEAVVKLSLTHERIDECIVTAYGIGKRKGIVKSLKGKVAGIRAARGSDKTSESIKIKGVSPVDKLPAVKIKPKDEDDKRKMWKNNAGILTAAEWNDIVHWDFWIDLMSNDKWKQKQSYWGFYPVDKIDIVIQNKYGNSIPNLNVTLNTYNDEILFRAKTDAKGKAVLFPSLFQAKKYSELCIKITNSDGLNIVKKDIAPTKSTQIITIDENYQSDDYVDIMFVIDATGSMGDEMNYLKTELSDIIDRVHTAREHLQPRIGMVFYRDKTDNYIVRDFEFDKNINNVQKNLNNQFAGGGGDFEEAVDEGLEAAILQKQWKPNASARLLFLILDAPPHHNKQSIAKIQKSCLTAAEKGIKIIPVVASGIDKNTEFLMRFLSIATNGTYTFLTDDSGVGNSHLKPTTGDYQIEKLNDLLVRLILENTSLVSYKKTVTY